MKTKKDQNKKKGLHRDICEKAVLAHVFCGVDQHFGSFKPRTALQWHRACYFLSGTILVWRGTILIWGAQTVIWGEHGPGMPPMAPSVEFHKRIDYL